MILFTFTFTVNALPLTLKCVCGTLVAKIVILNTVTYKFNMLQKFKSALTLLAFKSQLKKYQHLNLMKIFDKDLFHFTFQEALTKI